MNKDNSFEILNYASMRYFTFDRLTLSMMQDFLISNRWISSQGNTAIAKQNLVTN